MNIRNVLEKMIAARASDLHLKVGTPPVVRVDGVLYTLDEAPPNADHLRAIVHQPGRVDAEHSCQGGGHPGCDGGLAREQVVKR